MKDYICSVCGYVYSEAQGIPEAGIAPGTRWEELPEAWVCPLCGATKAEFEERTTTTATPITPVPPTTETSDNLRELTPLQISSLCSNLAHGCEKQYKPEEAASFQQLADYFSAASPPVTSPDTQQLLALIEQDLSEGIPMSNALAEQARDRGALRALVWNEKVTKILKSLLKRYQRDGDKMLENTGVYVCIICGFVYIGKEPPALCPVCKAPGWKLETVKGRAS